MKGFSETKIGTESLSKGLRSDSRNRLNKPGLLACMNMKPVKDEGLVYHEDIDNLFPSVTFDFPFPQVFKGKGETLLANRTSLYQVGQGLALSAITTYDVYNPTQTMAIPEGGQWDFIDHGTTWMLTNGECCVFKTRKSGLFRATEKVYVQKDVRFNSGTHHRGRAVIGGFNEKFFWNTAWEAIWATWEATMPGGLSVSDRGLKGNYVLWSTIGGDLIWLTMPSLARTGLVPFTAGGTDTGFDTGNFTNQMFLDQLKRNELGWMPMPFQGDVIRIEELGKDLIVYGTDGIAVLNPVGDPYPTYGCELLSGVGLAQPGALIDGGSYHKYIGADGCLWKISRGYTISGWEAVSLGFYEFFHDSLKDDWAGSSDDSLGEGYLSTKQQTFIVTEEGVGQTHQIITSGMFHEDEFKGIVSSNGNTEQKIVLDSVDFGLGGIKLLQAVELGLSDYSEVIVAVATRFSKKGPWLFSDWVPINDEGWAVVNTSGIEFRLMIKGKPGQRLAPAYTNYRWNVTDKRNIRGIYAS